MVRKNVQFTEPCQRKILRVAENPLKPLLISRDYIPLTNRVRGPYRKLRTEFFSPPCMAQARSARAINRRGKKRGSVTYSTDREDEVSKIFIISLVCV